MYNELKEEYVFVIVGDKTKAIIQQLELKRSQTKQNFENYLATQGVKITRLDGTTMSTIDFDLADGITQPPEGWSYSSSKGKKFLNADFNTQAGESVHLEIGSFLYKYDIKKQFNNVCHDLAPCCHFNNKRYDFEEVGDNLIVICPKDYDGTASVPADAQIISYLHYEQLKETASPSAQPVTTPFKNTYQP
jgi:hypothetical protein